jgi:hypothetical protein
MKERQFLEVAASTKINVRMLAAAQRVLVEREGLSEVAADIGCSRQRLHAVVTRLLQEADMLRVRLCIPAEDLAELRALVRDRDWTVED